MGTILDLHLQLLRMDEQYQPCEQELDHEHLERLRASDPAAWPPLVVSPTAAGTYDVIDGFHRLQVARERGLTTLRCQVVDGAGYPDAVRANLTHGLPLSLADRKAFACLLHAEEPTLSLRELGRQSGLSDKTVKAALAEPAAAENPQNVTPRYTPPPPDPVERLVKLAARAMADETGVNKLAQVFSRKSDARQRAEYIGRIIAGYAPDQRPELAAALAAFGTALIDGARAYAPQPTG